MVQFDEIFAQMNGDVKITEYGSVKGSDIQEFYANKTLFITGATGYMGICLLEKLLRSCSDLKHIYLLMREKAGASLDKRLKNYFEHEMFGPLRKMNPSFERKVTALKGDLAADNLGLSKADRDILRNKVNIIIHNGSNVKFTERVNILLSTNVLGTKNLLDLAEECQNLNVFVYVSTAYSHCYRREIMEEFYKSPEKLSSIHEMIRIDKSAEMNEKTVKKWIGKNFNVYTFSKAMSEELVRQYSERSTFACGIFRPSIVSGILKEPLPGWAGNSNGAVLPQLMYCLGVMHVLYYNNQVFDLIPCDMTINALIVITRNLHDRWLIENKPVIYNYGTSVEFPLTITELCNIWNRHIIPRARSSKAIWMNFLIMTNNIVVFTILHILFHFIPACLADLVLLITGKKTKVLAIFFKVTRAMDKLIYLTNSDWRIHVTETRKAIDSLNSIDKELFYCDVREIQLEESIFTTWLGSKKYLLKEPLHSDAAERRSNLLWYAHYGLITVLVMAFCYIFWRLIF